MNLFVRNTEVNVFTFVIFCFVLHVDNLVKNYLTAIKQILFFNYNGLLTVYTFLHLPSTYFINDTLLAVHAIFYLTTEHNTNNTNNNYKQAFIQRLSVDVRLRCGI